MPHMYTKESTDAAHAVATCCDRFGSLTVLRNVIQHRKVRSGSVKRFAVINAVLKCSFFRFVIRHALSQYAGQVRVADPTDDSPIVEMNKITETTLNQILFELKEGGLMICERP